MVLSRAGWAGFFAHRLASSVLFRVGTKNHVSAYQAFDLVFFLQKHAGVFACFSFMLFLKAFNTFRSRINFYFQLVISSLNDKFLAIQ